MTAKKTEELDFSPFNAEDVLTALCKVLRTSKAISFSYAGDIQSLIERIGRVYHAERGLMFVAGKSRSRVEIFEYVAESIEPVAHKFGGLLGQSMAHELMSLDEDINTLDGTNRFADYLDGGYLLPIKIRGDAFEGGGKDRWAGLLYLKQGENSRWNKLVLDTFVVVADHLARLAQIEQLSSSLAELEREDKVTGFLQKRFASEVVEKELERVNHFGDPATLILIDLDLGSNSPVVYGTGLGESVIKTVASVIATNSRSGDICCRLGLDEFLLFCPRLDEKEGMKLAHHLVKRINESLMNLIQKAREKIEPGTFVPTTASLGVAHRSQGDDYGVLFASAQEALNAARVGGGNRAKCLKVLDNN